MTDRQKRVNVIFAVVAIFLTVALIFSFVNFSIYSNNMEELLEIIEETDYLTMGNIMLREEIALEMGFPLDQILSLREKYTSNPCKETAEEYANALDKLIELNSNASA